MAIKTYRCNNCSLVEKRFVRKEIKCTKCSSSDIELLPTVDFIKSNTNFSKSTSEQIKNRMIKTLKDNINKDYYNSDS